MKSSYTAAKSITIRATPEQVWKALTEPKLVKQYMFGADVTSDWQKGSSLVYRGVWDGRPFVDKGTILEIEPGKVLKATYFSALSGLPDKLENYNTVTYQLAAEPDGQTTLTVTQENNASQEAADQAQENWGMTLMAIKQLVEG